MKREQKKTFQQSIDDKVQSRMGLKHKLYNIGGGDFDLSHFTQSSNDIQRFNSIFPQINQPTLQDSEPGEHIKLNDDSGLQQYYGEGITARNSYDKNNKSNSQIYQMEIRIDEYTQEIAKLQSQIGKYKATNQIMKKQMERIQNQLKHKNDVIERQKKEIVSLKQKHLTFSQFQNKSSSTTTKSMMMEQSINNFCPQLLSPEQTVELLNHLLKKVSKSSKMMKTLTSNMATRQLLFKINKN